MTESDRYLLESDGEIGGILVREGAQFIFHASARWAWTLQDRRFPDLPAAQRALDVQRREANQAA